MKDAEFESWKSKMEGEIKILVGVVLDGFLMDTGYTPREIGIHVLPSRDIEVTSTFMAEDLDI